MVLTCHRDNVWQPRCKTPPCLARPRSLQSKHLDRSCWCSRLFTHAACRMNRLRRIAHALNRATDLGRNISACSHGLRRLSRAVNLGLLRLLRVGDFLWHFPIRRSNRPERIPEGLVDIHVKPDAGIKLGRLSEQLSRFLECNRLDAAVGFLQRAFKLPANFMTL